MKKIKLVSAAAAALLAVSPLISSTVSAADISVNVTNGATAPATTSNQELKLDLNVNNISSIQNNSPASSLNVNLSSNFGNPRVDKVVVYRASDIKNGQLNKDAKAVSTIEAGKTYVAVAKGVTLSGLTSNGKYTFNNKEVTADTYGNITTGYTVISKEFTTPDTSLIGTPYFVENNNVVTSGNVNLTKGQNSVDGLVSAISNKYSVRISGTAKASWANLKKDVENSLSAANISVNSKGEFSAPANTFEVTVTAAATNTKTASMRIAVNAYQGSVNYSGNPVITYNGQKYDHSQKITLASNASFNYMTPNTSIDVNAIQNAFSAVVSDSESSNLPVFVDTSKVNTAVVGKYPVTVTATNANQNTTTLTFDLVVGSKDAAYKTLKEDATVYNINGNSVISTNMTLPKNLSIATFGTLTVNGVSYTEINRKNSNQFIETKSLEAASEPNKDKVKVVKKTVMHNAAAYTKNGKRTKKAYKKFKSVKVEATKVTIKNRQYYKIDDKNEYLLVDNIDGTLRTLKHNAYIYKTSTRRANRRVLKKGSKVRTFGGSYRFRNHKTYYRIAKSKQFVRVVNFYK